MGGDRPLGTGGGCRTSGFFSSGAGGPGGCGRSGNARRFARGGGGREPLSPQPSRAGRTGAPRRLHGLGGRQSPLEASWPRAGEPGGSEGRAVRWHRASSRRERDLRGGCAEERLRCRNGPLWIVVLRYPDLQEGGRYWLGNLSEQFGDH